MAKVKEVKVAEVKGRKRKCVELTDGTKVFQENDDIEDLLYNAYASKFTTGKTDNKSWIASFVDQQMDSLKKNLKADPMTALSSMRELNRTVGATKAYFDKKRQVDRDFSAFLLRKMLFPWQQKVFDSKADRKTLCCGRRSGKTYSVVQQALDHCLQSPLETPSGSRPRQAAIIGLTFEKTYSLYWSNLKKTVEQCHIPVLKADNSNAILYLSNGNTISLLGNNSKAEREKIRGADYSFIAIDECQSQGGMWYLCEDILKPILKGTAGTLVMLGTGPIAAGSYWEQCLCDDSFEHFHATMEDNPTIPNYETALKDVLEQNHWKEDNITFRREYLGEIAYDTERQIYPERTYYDRLPEKFRPRYCYIGLDYGWADYSSFAPILIDDKGEAYLVREWKQNRTASSVLVDKARELTEYMHKTYGLPYEDIKIVADTSHQQVSQDIYNAGVENIQNAYKLDEGYQIARVSEALSVGYLHIQKGGPFDSECDALVWKWNSEKGCVIYEIDEDVFHPDMADSVKYAYNTYLTDRNKQDK